MFVCFATESVEYRKRAALVSNHQLPSIISASVVPFELCRRTEYDTVFVCRLLRVRGPIVASQRISVVGGKDTQAAELQVPA